MKLSITKRFGWTQVRGGRLLRVARAHDVPTAGMSLIGGAGRSRARTETLTQARVGDLAVEIIYVGTNKVAGHSYLSGSALQLNRYLSSNTTGPSWRDNGEGWFTLATGRLVTIPHINDGEAAPQFLDRVLHELLAAKYSTADVNAFEYLVGYDTDAENAARAFRQMWERFAAEDGTPPTTHFLGAVRGKKAAIHLHFQPPAEASEFSATPFQSALVLGACRAMDHEGGLHRMAL